MKYLAEIDRAALLALSEKMKMDINIRISFIGRLNRILYIQNFVYRTGEVDVSSTIK
jgi:hypothetical protein